MGFVDYKGPDLDKYIVDRKHKWVTYEEGAKLYGMPYWTFVHLAKEAKTIYRVKRMVLVNIDLIDAYLENFREE